MGSPEVQENLIARAIPKARIRRERLGSLRGFTLNFKGGGLRGFFYRIVRNEMNGIQGKENVFQNRRGGAAARRFERR